MKFLNLARKELFFVSAVAITLIIVTSLPYFWGYHSVTSGKYLGASYFLPGDYYSYLSWITQAENGTIFMRNLYAPEYQGGFLFHPIFLLLGLLSKLFAISAPVIYHLARIFFIAVFCFFVYALYSLMTEKIQERRVALLLLVSTAGFGSFLGKISADIWMPEINMFFSFYLCVLNVASLSLVLLFAIVVLKNFHKRNWLAVVFCAGLLSTLSLIHSYDVILLGGIILVYSIARIILYGEFEFFMNVLWTFALTLPAVIWQSTVLANDEGLSMWYFTQMFTPSPILFSYIFGLGILLFFACIGIYFSHSTISREKLFFLVWLAVVFLLLYNPFFPDLQRRFSEGIQIPLAFFASIAVLFFLNKRRVVRFVVILLLVTSLLTNIQIIYKDMFVYPSSEKPRMLSRDEVAAIEWINKNVETNDVVLSEVFMGNIIPALTGRLVYMGHSDLTLNFAMKNHLLGYAFALGPSAPRLWSRLLHNGHIRYVVEDNEVRALGGSLRYVFGLKPVFLSDTVVIYSVAMDHVN